MAKAAVIVPNTPIHEMAECGLHRIVIPLPDGLFEYSNWSPDPIIFFQKMYAVRPGHPDLPTGVWSLREVPHRVLT